MMMLVHGDGDDADDDDHESDDAGHDVGDDDDVDDDDDNADVDGDDGSSVFLRLACSPPPLILSFRGRQSPNTTKNVFFEQV